MRAVAERAGSRPDHAIRVLAVSDEVAEGLLADVSQARSAQLIVACGDLPAEYLGALMNALDLPLVFVPGNHDRDQSGYRVSRSGLITRAGFPARPPWPLGAVNADGRVVDVAGVRLAGLGGCLRYGDGPNQYSERQQARRGRGPPPPRGLRRAPPRGGGEGDDLPPRGFGCYHELVAALDPPLLLHGHVHPYGTAVRPGRLGRTAVRNVTGWHLIDLGPGAAELQSEGAELRPEQESGRAG